MQLQHPRHAAYQAGLFDAEAVRAAARHHQVFGRFVGAGREERPAGATAGYVQRGPLTGDDRQQLPYRCLSRREPDGGRYGAAAHHRDHLGVQGPRRAHRGDAVDVRHVGDLGQRAEEFRELLYDQSGSDVVHVRSADGQYD
jgi:hypothetical protein